MFEKFRQNESRADIEQRLAELNRDRDGLMFKISEANRRAQTHRGSEQNVTKPGSEGEKDRVAHRQTVKRFEREAREHTAALKKLSKKILDLERRLKTAYPANSTTESKKVPKDIRELLAALKEKQREAKDKTPETAAEGVESHTEQEGQPASVVPAVEDVASVAQRERERDTKKAAEVLKTVEDRRPLQDLELLEPLPEGFSEAVFDSEAAAVVPQIKAFEKRELGHEYIEPQERLHYLMLGIRANDLSVYILDKFLSEPNVRKSKADDYYKQRYRILLEGVRLRKEALALAKELYDQQHNQNTWNKVHVALRNSLETQEQRLNEASRAITQSQKRGIFSKIWGAARGRKKADVSTAVREPELRIPHEPPEEPISRSTVVVEPPREPEPTVIPPERVPADIPISIHEPKETSSNGGVKGAKEKVRERRRATPEEQARRREEQRETGQMLMAKLLTEASRLGPDSLRTLKAAQTLLDDMLKKSKPTFNYMEGFVYDKQPRDEEYVQHEINYLKAAALNMIVERKLSDFKGGYQELHNMFKEYLEEAQEQASVKGGIRYTVLAGILKNKIKDPKTPASVRPALKELLVKDLGFVGFKNEGVIRSKESAGDETEEVFAEQSAT